MPNPEKKFSCGGINASIFENEVLQSGKKIKIKKISFQKRFKDKDGSWKTASSLDIGDLPKAILVLSKGYEYLVMDTELSPPSEREPQGDIE